MKGGKEWPKTEKPSRKLYPKRRGCQINYLRIICLVFVVVVLVVAKIPNEVLDFLLVRRERNAGNLDFEGLDGLEGFGGKPNRLGFLYHDLSQNVYRNDTQNERIANKKAPPGRKARKKF